MGKIFGREPVLVLAAIQAIIAAAVGFGLEWTAQQVTLVTIAVAAVLSFIARGRVTPA